MKLSDFFNPSKVFRDKEFVTTYSPFSKKTGTVAFALSENVILKLNDDSQISAVITLDTLKALVDDNKGVIVDEDPQKTYYDLHNMLYERGLFLPFHKAFIHPTAVIADTAIISDRVYIGENVEIGHGVIIHNDTFIDDESTVEDYAVVGAKGMQNTLVKDILYKVHYSGGVVIGKNCQVLAHAIIQKPYQHFCTRIGDNVRISARVMIGHGSQVGDNSTIAGNCQLSGNVIMGKNVLVGPSATFSDGITISDNVNVKLGSVVISNIEEGDVVSGNFAYNHKRNLKNFIKRNLK